MVTLIELKKAKMNALKTKDVNAQAVLGVVIANYQKAESDKRVKNQEMTDADMVSLLQKVVKELEEEKAMYQSANKTEEADASAKQIEIIKAYLPKLMSEDEIKEVISSLEDKSIKNIMMTFKTTYAGKADMSLVSKIAKQFQ